MTRRTPEELALKRKKHTVLADLRYKWQNGELTESQIEQLEALGVSKHSAKDVTPGYNDLATINPSLAAQWHPTRNGDLTPQDVTAGSGRKIWWLGPCGHEWEATVAHRVVSGCPYCSGFRVIPGETDLATTNSDLAAQWHPTRNGDLTPQDVMAGSNKKVWWQCERGHEWETRISHRSKGIGCPFCSGQRAIPGENDLATIRPDLAAQWHPTRNGRLTPQQVVAGSGKKVWWRCDKGHEWEATVANRSKGHGCLFCSGRKVLPGFNDLATTDPELAAQWHPTRNGDLTPQNVTSGSGKKVWWLGKCGHEWEAAVYSRRDGTGCPYCSNKALLPDYNDLATKYPELAAQWHPTRNGRLTPRDVVAGSDKKVWWRCERGHEWEARIYNRSKGIGCPYCSGKKAFPGYNDLASTDPELAAQWHPTRNGDLTPQNVTSGSSRKIWWLGPCGHEWEATVRERSGRSSHKPTGCPVCARNARKKKDGQR